MVAALEKEKAEQMAHVKRVKSKLREIKAELFDKDQPLPKAESVHVSAPPCSTARVQAALSVGLSGLVMFLSRDTVSIGWRSVSYVIETLAENIKSI